MLGIIQMPQGGLKPAPTNIILNSTLNQHHA